MTLRECSVEVNREPVFAVNRHGGKLAMGGFA